jgi:ABC-type uncharacterized transport system ATPase component
VVHALDHLNLTIPRGGFVVIMGPNGAGKTSLLRVIDGTTRPDSGTVELSATGDDLSARLRVVHVSQDPRTRTFARLSMAELDGARPRVLASAVTRSRLRRFEALLREYHRDDLVPFLERPVAELSGGMRQAVSLLLTIVRPASADERALLLLLDEPTGALDTTNEERCLDLVNRLHVGGATVILVTHDPRLAASQGQRLVFLHRGRMAASYEGEARCRLSAADIGELLGRLVGDLAGVPVAS